MEPDIAAKNVELAYLGLCARGEKVTQKSMVEETLAVGRMLRPDSLPCLVQNCPRLAATIESVELEESSQRYVVTFKVASEDDSETARTERIDGQRGALVKRMWPGLAGHKALLFKHNDRVGEVKGAANGFRVLLWAVDLGVAPVAR